MTEAGQKEKGKWITDVDSLNALAESVRRFLAHPDALNQLAMRQTLDRAEDGMFWMSPATANTICGREK